MTGEKILVHGLVQGVGFRPFIARLANQLNITGQVRNTPEGVEIIAWSNDELLTEFRNRIQASAPPLAIVDGLTYQPWQLSTKNPPKSFRIVESARGGADTMVANDVMVCGECLKELFDPSNRRYRYPFINCMHCGPRFSIIKNLPYDRANTAMNEFTMCPTCQREYSDPEHRRFHAQPNACTACGPQIQLEKKDGGKIYPPEGMDDPRYAAELIKQGQILAVKNVGGFRLVCDASNNTVVKQLRQRKNRPNKPFALMARDIEIIRRYAQVSRLEENELVSNSSPIVLLKRNNPNELNEVAPDQSLLGFMLPNSALDFLLMEELDIPVVMTSANISGEPPCIDNTDARTQLADSADVFVTHNREIVNRVDDSVVMVAPARQVLRRARGFSATEMVLPSGLISSVNVLAMGAELKNTFCLTKKNKAVLSSHIGDLKSARTLEDYKNTIERYLKLYHVTPQLIAVDKHPDYLSTRHGHELAGHLDIPLVEVQHHHAHIAAAMVEHRLPSESVVLGIVMDGLGLGENGQFWGGEFLKVGYANSKKLAGLQAVPLPGGAQAMREPWRNAVAHLWQNNLLDGSCISDDVGGLFFNKPVKTIRTMLEKSINSPKASSCGRLIDAVAALLGLSPDKITYEGQAAIMLQALAESEFEREKGFYYPVTVCEINDVIELQLKPLWLALLADLKKGVEAPRIAARFHHTLIFWICQIARQLCGQHDMDTVALSGGVFQNPLLAQGCAHGLEQAGLRCFLPSQIPANDGGIALGQAAVAKAIVGGDGVGKVVR